MNSALHRLDWLVGPRLGAYTRLHYDSPSGMHFLTPDAVRKRYVDEIKNSALVVWRLHGEGLGGIRAGIDEISWRDADIACFETSFCRPAKGGGFIWLTAKHVDKQSSDTLIASSNQYSEDILSWHLSVAKLIEQVYPNLTRTQDNGCDA